MEKRYQSLSIFEFQSLFPDSDSCYQYLAHHKWSDGYLCKKCKHTHYCKGVKPYDRQCTSCGYIESPTANTVFHGIKFSLLKSFWIVYYLATSKKGMSSTELSRKLELRQKTCWLFRHKVLSAMKSSGQYPMDGDVVVDELVVGQQEIGTIGRKNLKKKLLVFAIEKKGKGVSRLYGKVIDKASAKNLGAFMNEIIDKNANIKTDGWSGYKPLIKQFPNLIQEKSQKKAANFKHMHRVIMGFKGWLRGIHHHASLLQNYVDEYAYRFNRSQMKKGTFENLMNRMILGKPITYKMIIG